MTETPQGGPSALRRGTRGPPPFARLRPSATSRIAPAPVGASSSGPERVVGGQPPAPRLEVVPAEPGPGHIWIRGHWAWHHERWEWISGRWGRVVQAGSTWVPGQWVVRPNGWVWIEGRYAVFAEPPPPPPGQAFEVVASEEPPQPIVESV